MQPARDLSSYRKYWAQRFGIAPFLPTTRAEMDELGWDSCDVILVTGDAYVDHPSFGMALIGRAARGAGLPRRHPRPARLAQRRGVPRARPPEPVLRRDRRQHGLDGQPLHRATARIRTRRRVHAGRRRRPAARSLGDRLRAALPRGVRRRADRDRRHRGDPAPHRALRLLVGQGPPLDPARREGRPAASTATPSARSSRSRIASPRGEADRRDPRPARHRVRAHGAPAGLDRDRLDARSTRPAR